MRAKHPADQYANNQRAKRQHAARNLKPARVEPWFAAFGWDPESVPDPQDPATFRRSKLPWHEIESPQATVEEMTHHFLKVHQMDKPKVAAAIANGHYRTLIFVRTKRGADRLATQLRREGVRVAAIHGDLRQSQRERNLADFAAGKLPALVATDVAARGIHVEGIDVVVHYDPPEDHKAYIHRSGRTARAGEAGVVATLVLWNQELEVERLQKRLGLPRSLVEVFSNDARLGNLNAFEPVLT